MKILLKKDYEIKKIKNTSQNKTQKKQMEQKKTYRLIII